jgi:hypothetical protein
MTMTMRAFILAVCACATEAFVITAGMKRSPTLSHARSHQVQAMAPDVALTSLNSLPTTVMIADDTSSLLLASGGLISAIFLFAVVGTVVINFGIIRKK